MDPDHNLNNDYDNNPEWYDIDDNDIDRARYHRNLRRNQANQELNIEQPTLRRLTQVPHQSSGSRRRSNRLPVPRLNNLTLERLAEMSARLEEERTRERLQERRNPRGRVDRVWDAPHQRVVRQEDECPICKEDFENGDDIIYPKACGHEFHEECLLKVMERYPVGGAPCPMCRTHFFGSKRSRNR
jgi:hypothetical protein